MLHPPPFGLDPSSWVSGSRVPRVRDAPSASVCMPLPTAVPLALAIHLPIPSASDLLDLLWPLQSTPPFSTAQEISPRAEATPLFHELSLVACPHSHCFLANLTPWFFTLLLRKRLRLVGVIMVFIMSLELIFSTARVQPTGVRLILFRCLRVNGRTPSLQIWQPMHSPLLLLKFPPPPWQVLALWPVWLVTADCCVAGSKPVDFRFRSLSQQPGNVPAFSCSKSRPPTSKTSPQLPSLGRAMGLLPGHRPVA